MEFKFKPLEVFSWEREYEDGSKVFIGEYHPGMTYNCTKEPRHDALREKCKEWAEAGLIEIIPLGEGQRFVTVPLGEGNTEEPE